MKKVLFLLSILVVEITNLYAQPDKVQVNLTSCSSISVDILTDFPQDIIVDTPGDAISLGNVPLSCENEFECAFYLSYYSAVTNYFAGPSYQLQKNINGSFVNIGSPQSWINTFSNLPRGEYRVSVFLHSYSFDGCNSRYGGKSPVYEWGDCDMLVGFRGIGTGQTFTTNSILVGFSEESDMTWDFVDDNGYQILNNLFADGERVQINVTNHVPYGESLLMINERWPDGTLSRFRAKGCGGYGCFEPGLLPTTLDLTTIWNLNDPINGWKFEYGKTYQVHIVIRNPNCQNWTMTTKEFAVCPPGFSCRENINQESIKIAPNPNSGEFTLINFKIDDFEENSLNLSIVDVLGREVKRFNNIKTNQFDIKELSGGVYITNLTSKGKRIHSTKFILKK